MSKVRLAGSVNFAHAIPVIYNPHMLSLWSLSDEMSEPDSEPELVSLPRRCEDSQAEPPTGGRKQCHHVPPWCMRGRFSASWPIAAHGCQALAGRAVQPRVYALPRVSSGSASKRFSSEPALAIRRTPTNQEKYALAASPASRNCGRGQCSPHHSSRSSAQPA